MHGDFEAQRHWLEITTQLQPHEWYRNGTHNDLMYWGLDYPPLTAYFSWIVGRICGALYPPMVALGDSHGLEDAPTRTLMRLSVIASDLLLLFPAIAAVTRALFPGPHASSCTGASAGQAAQLKPFRALAARSSSVDRRMPLARGPLGIRLGASRRTQGEPLQGAHKAHKGTLNAAGAGTQSVSLGASRLTAQLALVLSPALILIDHGHFQYNNVSLALFLFALTCFLRRRDALGAALLVLCALYKQMGLFYAPVGMAYVAGRALRMWRTKGFGTALLYGLRVGLAACVAAVLSFAPILLLSPRGERVAVLGDVLHRMFPVARGLYEDKVANVWCTISPVLKLKQFAIPTAIRISLIATLAALAAPCLALLVFPAASALPAGFACCAYAFYLLGFQVHEKTILFPLVPHLLALVLDTPLPARDKQQGKPPIWNTAAAARCFALDALSVHSMYPLLCKDGLRLAAWTLVAARALWILTNAPRGLDWRALFLPWRATGLWNRFIACLRTGSFAALLGSLVAFEALPAPAGLPDLLHLALTSTAAVHFMGSACHALVGCVRRARKTAPWGGSAADSGS